MLEKTRAVVLHSIKYGDSSMIVHAFTEAWGRTSFMMKGVRKSKKSNRANIFQPLYLLDLDIYYRDTRELHWIREATLMRSQPVGYADMVKSTQALFLSEVLMKTVHEEERNQELFDFLQDSLSYFHNSEHGIPSFHLLFLFHLSRFLGFYPMNNYAPIERPYFNPDKGSFSGLPGSGALEKEKLLVQYWSSCFDLRYDIADQGFNNQEKRNLFLDSLLDFYDHHHPSIGKMKSLEVLRTVFGS